MLRLNLRYCDEQLHASLQDANPLCESRTRVGRAELSELGMRIRRILALGWQHRGGNRQDHVELNTAGRLLGDLLLNREMAEQLEKAKGELLVIDLTSDLLNVPWELTVANGHSLNAAFAIGRNLVNLPASTGIAARRINGSGPTTLSIWANPTFDLLSAEREALIIKQALRGRDGIQAKSCRPAGLEPLLSELNVAEAFHYAGHSDDHLGSRWWRLAEGVLTGRDILSLKGSLPRFLFAHSCGSAQIDDPDDPESCLLLAFLRRGVEVFLGLWTPFLDEHGGEFTKSFYSQLSTGKSLGVALFETRKTLTAKLGWGEILTGNYVLYGDPRQQLFSARAGQVLNAARPKTPPAGVRLSSKRTSAPLLPTTAASEQTDIDPRQLSYPVHCGICSRKLNSHFLVGSIALAGDLVHVSCRVCDAQHPDLALAHSRKTRPALETHSPAGRIFPGSANPPPQPSAELDLTVADRSDNCPENQAADDADAPPEAWARLLRYLEYPQAVCAPQTGFCFQAFWRPLALDRKSADYSLASRDGLQSLLIPDWKLSVRFLELDVLQLASDEFRKQLLETAAELRAKQKAERNYVVFAFAVPAATPAIEEIGNSQASLDAQVRASHCLLLNLMSEDPREVITSAAAVELLKYLNWDPDLIGLRRLIGKIEALRPLPASISIQDLAKKILAPEELVLNACRILTEHHRSMHLDNIEPYGWVLSESAKN